MAWRRLLALFYGVAGVLHIVAPAPFLAITPRWVPMPGTVVLLTGIAEILGAAGLVQGRSLPLRRAAACGLALYALCVFPANINHMMLDLAGAQPGPGLAYHIPRLMLQPVLIWLALWAGQVVDWPFAREPAPRE